MQIKTVSLSTLTVSRPSRGRRSRVDLHPRHLVCHLLHGSRWAVVLRVWGVRSWQVPGFRDVLLSNSRPENANRSSVTKGAMSPRRKVLHQENVVAAVNFHLLLSSRMQKFQSCIHDTFTRYNQLCLSFKSKKVTCCSYLLTSDWL